jgi:predicted glycosyltransferase
MFVSMRRPRVLFYSHDSYGMGHLRRTTALAGELARRRPVSLLALTGALYPNISNLSPSFDFIKLPALARYGVYEDLPVDATDAATSEGVWYVRERIIREATTAFAPHVVVVDDTPPGEERELIRTLARLRRADPRPTLIIGLRDITDRPDYTRERWRRDGSYDLLDQTYDRILVYGSREVFDPITEYGLSQAAADKTIFTGYLGRGDRLTPPDQIRALCGIGSEPLVVVTAGGGVPGGEELIHMYLAACRASLLAGLVSFVVTGPLLLDRERAEFADAAASLDGVTLVPFLADMPSYLNAADVVVTAFGYNTACETVGRGKRVLVAPILSEQQLRAERFEALGLVTQLNQWTPERLAETIWELLAAPPPVPRLKFDGLRRFGDVLEEILGPGYTPFDEEFD